MKDGLFDEKEVNPTIRKGYTVTASENVQFETFAKKMGIPLSALIRISVKNYIATEGEKYVQSK